jgi:hypothetical protein
MLAFCTSEIFKETHDCLVETEHQSFQTKRLLDEILIPFKGMTKVTVLPSKRHYVQNFESKP